MLCSAPGPAVTVAVPAYQPKPARAQIVSVQYPRVIYINTLVPNIVEVKNIGETAGRFGVKGQISGLVNLNFVYVNRLQDYDGYSLPLSQDLLMAEGTLANGTIAYFTLRPGEQKKIIMGAPNPYGCGGGTCTLWLDWWAGVIDQSGNFVADSIDHKTFPNAIILAP